ncbi:hypothetical protein [Mucilaginibacter jinjuensis]|uniref:ABC transporter permease n=1 Tax=Mucilaginibacter jinjuensis TaxID=1176721 RepID=A0ABY7T686_9SPHI|nr:hypothetical protein [Mucilaginibacter jinjuensis]WCT11778.1 hypothetical protein PQO05_23900 [Mucilaginibacter jinjuensis]
MNDTFNLQRFGFLFKKTILERPMQLVGIMALTLIATLTIFSFCIYFNHWHDGHIMAFTWGYLGGGIILASVVFNYFNTNASGSAYLTLPASSFEKWLCGVLISGVLFTLIFLLFYRIMDASAVIVYHSSLDKTIANYQFLYNEAHIFEFNDRKIQFAYYVFLNFAGAALLGSLYFNKANFIKTTLVIIAVILFMMGVNYLIARMFFSNLDSAFPYLSVGLQVGNDYRMINVSSEAEKRFTTCLKYVVPAILWLTAYIRLREKEI